VTAPLRIALGAAAPPVDAAIVAGDEGTWLTLSAPPADAGDARIHGTPGAVLGGWGIVEALGRGAGRVRVDPVAPGGRVAGLAAWRFGWDREAWDQLAGGVVAGLALDAGGPGTVVAVAADGSFVLEEPSPAAVVDLVLRAVVRAGLTGPELVEPDAAVRLATVRVEKADAGGVRVHAVRGMPGPDVGLVRDHTVSAWTASATLAVLGPDVDERLGRLAQALPAAVELRVRRRGYPDPVTFAEASDDVVVTATAADAAHAQDYVIAALATIGATAPTGLWVTGRPSPAVPAGEGPVSRVPTSGISHAVVLAGDTIEIPPAPTTPPPLARRSPDPAAAGRRRPASVSTHPETIAALRDDLRRRRLAAGPADDESVHWDAQPTRRVPLGRVARARSAPTADGRGPAVGVVFQVDTDDAYDWLEWYLTTARLETLLPRGDQAGAVTRVELPNVNALGFVIRAALTTPAEHLADYLGVREADVPRALYPSSALRTSAT
jgi:hypothetical protein